MVAGFTPAGSPSSKRMNTETGLGSSVEAEARRV